MTVVNVYEAKTHLSRLLRRVRAGEEVIIADAGTPIARLVALEPATGPRELGGDERTVWMADDFNAPLPSAIVDEFWGGAPAVATPAERKVRAPRRPKKR